MTPLQLGALVRLNNNLVGRVNILEDHRAKIEWRRTRGKGIVVRTSSRWFKRDEIIPSDEADFNAGMAWRLQFFPEDGHGKSLSRNLSAKSDLSTRKPWTPYSV